jgi:hypothetical protein
MEKKKFFLNKSTCIYHIDHSTINEEEKNRIYIYIAQFKVYYRDKVVGYTRITRRENFMK